MSEERGPDGRFVLVPPEERFWPKVDRRSDDECWPWLGVVGSNGYGYFARGHRDPVPAHRFAYESHVGPIPTGLQIDHLCRVRHCVNPSHLEAVTCRENLLRGETRAARNARKTHCPEGHALAGSNLYVSKKGERGCRICRLTASQKHRARKKQRA